jgi:NAD(P)-dependent dehydrogenase (short-subunit alcohol dehydrogenase family)
METPPKTGPSLSLPARLLDEVLEASVVGSFTRIGPALRRRSAHWAPPAEAPGRVVVLTGASSGLGRTAAIELGGLGCSIVAVGRDRGRLGDVVAAIADQGGTARAEICDLADLEATSALAERLRSGDGPIDVLIHNAGALAAERREGPQGFEATVAVQVLSPYLLTEQLLGSLAPRAKVITMTSGGMYTEAFDIESLEMDEQTYKGSVAYARAKRAQVVLTSAWQRSEPPGRIDFHAVHPGWAATEGLSKQMPGFAKAMGPLLRTPEDGVDTLVWLATQPEGIPAGGQLWLDRRPRKVSRLPKTRVDEAAARTNEAELLTFLAETTAKYRDDEEE